MPRVRPRRKRTPLYNAYKKIMIEQAKKDHEFNRYLSIKKKREPPFSLFSVQPEYFLGIK